MHALEIIDEAAKHVSEETKGVHPEIPWKQMIGIRNRLVHEYFQIKLAAVWEIIKQDLPYLVKIIELLVPKEDEI